MRVGNADVISRSIAFLNPQTERPFFLPRVPAHYLLAVTVISIFPRPRCLTTTTVVRVGRGSLKYCVCTWFIRGSVATSASYTIIYMVIPITSGEVLSLECLGVTLSTQRFPLSSLAKNDQAIRTELFHRGTSWLWLRLSPI